MSNNGIHADAIKLFRQIKRDCHVLPSGLTAAQQVEQATQIMRNAIIDAPGKEPKILIETTNDDGEKKRYVPKGCEFERFGVRPYGWPVNPYDVTRYPMDNHGLAQLFTDSFARGKVAWHKDACVYMGYNGKIWVRDGKSGGMMYRAQDEFIEALRHACDCIDDKQFRDDFAKLRVAAAISESGRRAMANHVQAMLEVGKDEWDADPNVIHLQNGTYHLDTDVFEAGHRPEDLLTKIAGTSYDPSAKSDLFENFLRQVFENNQERIDFSLRWFGYSLRNTNPEEKMVIAYGVLTRNGKGTYQAALEATLGDYVGTASEKMIAVNSKISDSTRQEYVASMEGSRVVAINELSRNCQLDADLIKKVTGGDTIEVVRKYEKEYRIKIYPHIVCWTNHLPRTGDPTLFASNRIMVLPFEHHFVDSMESQLTGQPVDMDTTLKDRLKAPSELPGILNALLRGWRDYKQRGKLDPPQDVLKATKEYMEIDDPIIQYIRDCYVETKNPKDIILASKHFEQFKIWADKNNFADRNKSTYKKDMARYTRDTKYGRDALVGFRLRTEDDGEWVDPADAALSPAPAPAPEKDDGQTTIGDHQLTIGPAKTDNVYDDDDLFGDLPF